MIKEEDRALQLAVLGGEYMERNRFTDSDLLLKRAYKVTRKNEKKRKSQKEKRKRKRKRKEKKKKINSTVH